MDCGRGQDASRRHHSGGQTTIETERDYVASTHCTAVKTYIQRSSPHLCVDNPAARHLSPRSWVTAAGRLRRTTATLTTGPGDTETEGLLPVCIMSMCLVLVRALTCTAGKCAWVPPSPYCHRCNDKGGPAARRLQPAASLRIGVSATPSSETAVRPCPDTARKGEAKSKPQSVSVSVAVSVSVSPVFVPFPPLRSRLWLWCIQQRRHIHDHARTPPLDDDEVLATHSALWALWLNLGCGAQTGL